MQHIKKRRKHYKNKQRKKKDLEGTEAQDGKNYVHMSEQSRA